jgi:hypothetical protein
VLVQFSGADNQKANVFDFARSMDAALHASGLHDVMIS